MSKISKKISSSSMSIGWQKLPDIIFGDIMMMNGIKCLEDLHKCREVCQSWNVMIMQMTKSKKDNIRRITDSAAEYFMKAFTSSVLVVDLSLYHIVIGANLAHHGMLGSWKTKKMILHNLDLASVPLGLASVPAKHLEALASCNTRSLSIENVRNIDMTILLASMKCSFVTIAAQSLGSEETKGSLY